MVYRVHVLGATLHLKEEIEMKKNVKAKGKFKFVRGIVKRIPKIWVHWSVNKQLVSKYIAKPIAYATLITTSALGFRTIFSTLEDLSALLITLLLVSTLSFILWD